MAVHEMTGRDESYILNKMPEAVGLQYHSLWWERHNERRQLSAFDKIPEILVLAIDEGEPEELTV